MKKLGLIILSIAFIFAMIGCPVDNSAGKVNSDDDPVINGVSYVRGGGGSTPVTKNEQIQLNYHETVSFSADVSNGDTYSWTAVPTDVVHISNETALTTTIQGTKVEGGETEITFTAKNGNLNDTFKFKINVAPQPVEGLWLRVFKGELNSDKELFDSEIEDFNIFSSNSGLTFTATALLDGNNVSNTITWTPDKSDVVTITPNTGGSVIIAPAFGVESGTVEISAKVTTAKTGANYSDKEIKFVITIMSGVLFAWDTTNTITGLTGSGQAWTHPNFANFLEQKNGYVKTLRAYGAGVNANDGLRINNSARLVIGQTTNTVTAAGDNPLTTTLGGEIDLYRKKVLLTLEYKDLTDIADRIALRIFVNQNTSGQVNSMFGGVDDPAPCSLATYRYADIIAMPNNDATAGTIVLEINTMEAGSHPGGALFGHANEAGLANAFICLLNQDNTANTGITFTGIKLEFIDGEETQDPLGLDVKEGNVSVPPSGIRIVKPDTTAMLTAETHPTADSITWAIADITIATLSSTTGPNVTVTAVKAGTTSITITAVKDGYFTAHKTIDVTVEDLPIQLTVKDGTETVGTAIQMHEGDAPKTLTAEVDPNDAVISWESNNTAAVTVSSPTGTTVNIAAVAEGHATITVKAEKAGYMTETKTFSVAVYPAGVDVDPNLIFEWVYARDGAPKAGETDINGAWAQSTANATLSGIGQMTSVKARVMGTNSVVSVDNEGIIIDATGATSRLMIGSTYTTATNFITADANADFNFFDDGRDVKVSVNYKILTPAAAASRALWLLVNNNGSGMQDTSPINNGNSGVANNSTASRIYASSTLLAQNATGSMDGTLGVSTLVNGKDSLKNAFVSICALGGTTTNAGYKVLITAIKIEYIGEPSGGGDDDDNLIWAWNSSSLTQGVGTLASGTLNGTTGSGITNPGAMPFAVSGTGISVVEIGGPGNTVKAIKIDELDTTAAKFIAIGTSVNTATAGGTLTTVHNGVFDFVTGNTKGIKITIEADLNIVGRDIAVWVYNNTASTTNTPLSLTGNPGRLFYDRNNTAPSAGSYDNTNIVTKTILPSDFPDKEEFIKNAWIGIVIGGGPGATSSDPSTAIIKSIRIEYLP
ncbi:MAG: hypothetical protein FWB73_05525 [Treponema sp.]|nr:hypothetical protein [Treponema sp.]